MSITYEDDLNNDKEELFAIFAMEDLRLLCQVFNSINEMRGPQPRVFKVEIHGSSEVRGQELDHTHRLSRQILEPLTELYDIARFTISGPVNEDYKVKIINQIARPAPRHEDSLEMIRELWIQGEAAFKGNRVAFAQKKYIAAILQLESRDWDTSMIESGRDAKRSRITSYNMLLHGLLHSLAVTFLEMRIFGKAHHWASHALHIMTHHMGRITHSPAQYGELAHLIATANRALGERHRAVDELRGILRFSPHNVRVEDELITLYGEIGRVPELSCSRAP